MIKYTIQSSSPSMDEPKIQKLEPARMAVIFANDVYPFELNITSDTLIRDNYSSPPHHPLNTC